MNEEMTLQLKATAERLANAAAALDRVLERLDAQQEALNAKVDRIVAAVDERFAAGVEIAGDIGKVQQLQQQIAELEKANADLKAQAAQTARKTLPPLVSALLSKNGSESREAFDPALLDKTLKGLSIDQRIAVKAEMARAGMIE